MQHMHHTFAMFQGQGQLGPQQGFVFRGDVHTGYRQLYGVLFKSVDSWEPGGRQKLAIHPQMGKAARARPIGQLGVHALTVHHQRGQQANVLPFELAVQLRHDAVWRLRGHGGTVVHTVLHAQFYKKQAQKVPDLGGGAHRAFAPATRESLLNSHRGRNAVHRIHIRPTRWLHDGTGVSVERLQVTALPFVEQNIKRQRRLARTRHARHHAELAPWYIHRQRFEVVLFGVDDANGVGCLSKQTASSGWACAGSRFGDRTASV